MAQNKLSDLKVDFVNGAVAHRYRFGGGRGQALPKAVGMKTGTSLKIIDATAGLGRDAFLLASLGAEVTMIERSKKMHQLLMDGMRHATNSNNEIAEIIARMTLHHGDAKELLPGLRPEIVLVDPMHPPRKGTALVKKELRQVRDIVGTDEDANQLMHIALTCASKRVVLKWPQKGTPMPDIPAPSHQINGKSTRYDVYMIQG